MRSAIVGVLAATGAFALGVDQAKYKRPAAFTVTDQVVNEAVEPFTATVGSFGNALVSAAFEPAVFRTRFFAEADAPDRVVLSATTMTSYDSLRDGFYEGAEVRVYRVVDGQVKIVRRDRVAPGGSAMGGWVSANGEGKLVAAGSGSLCEYRFSFDDYNRADATYWFTVTAVDKRGAESPKATAVSVVRTADKRTVKPEPTALLDFKAPKGAAPSVAPQAPLNVSATYEPDRGVARLQWKASPSNEIVAYRVYRSDSAPERHCSNYCLKLSGGVPKDPEAALRKGDWVVVGKTFTSYSRNAHVSHRCEAHVRRDR